MQNFLQVISEADMLYGKIMKTQQWRLLRYLDAILLGLYKKDIPIRYSKYNLSWQLLNRLRWDGTKIKSIIGSLAKTMHVSKSTFSTLYFPFLLYCIKNKKIAYLGDGNNVVYSLIEASVQFDFELCIACPKGCEPNENILKWARKNNANISIIKDPLKAVNSADCVMTDKWISMSDKINKKKKKKILKPYQINKKIMKQANRDAIFMHCLPASRGEEVINEVIDGKQSVVWVEALNRIHIQKSIIEWCLK